MIKAKEEKILTKQEKISAFDFLTWAALTGSFMSFWQFIIPFALFWDNPIQVFLGITSLFFMLCSMIVLFWSNKNYYFLKKEVEENPIIPPGHIEGEIYVMSYIIAASYITLLFGILLSEDYSWALRVANGDIQQQAIKESSIVTYTQQLLIIADIIILYQYKKYSYHLEFQPKHLPCILGYFLAFFIVMCSAILGDQNYLKSNIGKISLENVQIAEDMHTSIFWIAIVGIIVAFFFLSENINIQQQQVPKVRFYFLPFILLIGIGAYMFIQSLKFLYYSTQIDKRMTNNCKDLISMFSNDFVDTIGCPSKYQMFQYHSNNYYSQECPSVETSIVWELDRGLNNTDKKNQISCLNLNCCYLVTEVRTLNFKKFFMISFMASLIGLIAAHHCMVLASQKSEKIKAGPSIYTKTLFASQWIVAILAIIIAIWVGVRFHPILPDKENLIEPNSRSGFQINVSPQTQPKQNELDSVHQCKHPFQISGQQYTVKFDPIQCDPSIRNDEKKCNNQTYGFDVCLQSTNAVFQFDQSWNSEDCQIIGNSIYDKYKLQNGLNGLIKSDQICMKGQQDCINQALQNSLYACQPYGQINTTFQFQIKSIQLQSKSKTKNNKNDRILIHKQISSSMDKDHKEINNNTNININSTANSISNNNSVNQKNNQTENKIFINVKMHIFDAQTYQDISDAFIQVFQDADKCQILDYNIYSPIRSIQSQSSIQEINNIEINPTKKYMIQVRADNYLYHCFQITNLNQGQKERIVQVPLALKFTKEQMVKVMLHYQDTQLQLDLGGNFQINDTEQCNVGYFAGQCGGLKYENIEQRNKISSRVITLGVLGNYDYLFYARMVSKYHEINNIINNPGLELNDTQSKLLQAEIDQLILADVGINFYVRDNDYPISQYQMPIQNTQEFLSQPLRVIWLAICMDGKIGPISQAPIEHFWAQAGVQAQRFWERGASSTKMLPDSGICSQFYQQKEKQYPQI